MQHLLTFSLLTVLLLSALTDAWWRKIPNWLTFPAMVGAIALHIGLHGYAGLLFSLEGIGVGIGLLLGFYVLGGMGAGDVKLLGVVGGFVGPTGVLVAFLMTAVLGGAYAVALLIVHWGPREGIRHVLGLCKTWFLIKSVGGPPVSQAAEPRLRYGVVIAFGTLASELWAGRLYGV